jgi:hypothetical protein
MGMGTIIQIIVLIFQIKLLFSQLKVSQKNVEDQQRVTEKETINNCEKYKLDIIRILEGCKHFIYDDHDSHRGKFDTTEMKRKLEYLKANKLDFHSSDELEEILNILDKLNNEIDKNKNYNNFIKNEATKVEELKSLFDKFLSYNNKVFLKSDIENISDTFNKALLKLEQSVNSIETISTNLSNINTSLCSIKNYYIQSEVERKDNK